MPRLNLGDLTISSSDFEHGGPIPEVHAKAGGNEVPELTWEDVPDATAELVVMVHDPDAPMVDGFTHWIATGISPEATGVGGSTATEFTSGINSAGEAEYMGPAPPAGHGPHHYYFHLYALDTPVDTETLPDRAALLEAMEGHIIEQARVMGTYEVT